MDAVATAHTLDDQAETVMAKVLRGAWTEGIAGIHPVVEFAEGRVIRPLLGTRRAEVEAYLKALGQEWREDSSNRHVTFTRNRIRHELLPLLEGWNPRLKEHLAQMAELARDEESWWAAEVARVAPEVMLVGRPVRGGGRAAAEGLAVLEVSKLAALDIALQRRILRYTVERLGAGVDFAGTEKLRELALTGRAGQKCELGGGVRAERSHRELRLSIQGVAAEKTGPEVVEIPVPGEGEGCGVRLRIEVVSSRPSAVSRQPAVLRTWRAGDRVHLRHSSGPRKVKEVLERMKVSGSERAGWPVLEWNGRIVWMRGAQVEPEAGISVTAI
jgi:tRNA(Ile)-lysidine synthase